MFLTRWYRLLYYHGCLTISESNIRGICGCDRLISIGECGVDPAKGPVCQPNVECRKDPPKGGQTDGMAPSR